MAPHAEADIGFPNGTGVGTNPEKSPLKLTVNSPQVTYTKDSVESHYPYHQTLVEASPDGRLVATPKHTDYVFKTSLHVPKTGLLMVGIGGNDGTTAVAGILANRRKLSWDTREGVRSADYYGSLIMSSTMKLGMDSKGREINVPSHDMLPMVHPNDLCVGGWDISSMNLAESMDRAQVLEPSLKNQLRKEMALMYPKKSIYYPDFIAANQGARADNLLEGSKACMAHVEQLRKDIR